MRLLVATSNPHKLREIHGILAGVPAELVSLASFPEVRAPAETGATFAENARAKALYYSGACGLAAVAEDSGLEIDGLDGGPGVHSARFGGFLDDYARKFAIIYERLRARGALGSPARFVCALAVASGQQVVFETRGIIEGCIAPSPSGEGGFGYDPIFFYPPFGRTLAEMTPSEKAAVSHRGRAFRSLGEFLAGQRGEGLERTL